MVFVLTDRRNQLLLCLVLFMGTFMVGFDMSSVSSVTPEIAEHLHLDASQVTWVESIFMLFMAGMILIFGKVCDNGAMKKVLTFGLIAFLGGAFLCIITDSFPLILISRAVQGMGASTVWSATVTLGVRYLPKELVSWAMVSITTGEAMGGILGGPVTGSLLMVFEWNIVFFMDLLIGFISLLLVLRFVPRDARIERPGFDYKGAIMLAVLMFSGSYGLEVVAYDGFTPIGTMLVAVFILSLLMFIYFSKHASDPIIDLSVFNNRNTNRLTIIYIIELLVLNGLLFVMPFYSVNILHFSSVMKGFLMFVPPAVACISSLMIARVIVNHRSRPFMILMCSSLVVASVSMMFIEAVPTVSIPIVLLLTGLMWGLGEIVMVSSIINSAPDSKRCRVSVANSYLANLAVAVGTITWSKVFVISTGSEGVEISNIPYDTFIQGTLLIALLCAILGIIAFIILSRYKGGTSVTPADGKMCEEV